MRWRTITFFMGLGLAVCISGTAWANTEVDDAIFDTSSYPGTTCEATHTGLVYTGAATVSYAETAEPGPVINDSPVTPLNDVDLYEFVIQAGSVSVASPAILICEVTRDNPGMMPPGTVEEPALDPWIILWDANGIMVPGGEQDDYASEGGCTAQDSYMVFGITVAGTYYLGVSSLVGDGSGPPDYDPKECGTQGINYSFGPYDITIDLIPPSAVGGPHEDDNCIVDAMVLGPINLDQDYDGVVGDGKYGGSSGDYDLYEFVVAENCSLITATVKTDSIASDLQAVVNIYDGSCAILNQALHFDPHQAIDGEQPCDGDTICQWIVANSGTYYMDVHGNGTGSQFEDCGPATGAYAGGGAGSVGNYRLRVHVDGPGAFPTPTNPATEPNDWMGTAVATGLDQCGECYVLTGAFVGDGPCGCVAGDDVKGGDYDVYELYIPTGCELLVCLETVERGDSQADLATMVWIADGTDFVVFGLGDPICDGQCVWFCNPRDTLTSNKYYLSVSGVDVPTDITLAPNPPACDNDVEKEGVSGVGYYDLYMYLEPYLICQPTAWSDLCAEEGCSQADLAYILRTHYYPPACTGQAMGQYEIDCRLADDFVVPDGFVWRICDIHAYFRAIFGTGTVSTVPLQLIFRIHDTDPVPGCLEQPVPNRAGPMWEYIATGFVDCSKAYSRGLINLFSNDHDPCGGGDLCEEGLIELEAGHYWLSVIGVHMPGDIGGNAYGWVESNRPTAPCLVPSNWEDAQWQFNSAWEPGPPDLPCLEDWNSVLKYFQEGEIGECDFDMSWKLTGLELPGCCTTCMGDMKPDCDGIVNVTDFTVFALAFPSTSADPNYDICADVAPAGGDGFVNITDFTAWAVNFPGPCP